MDRGREETQDVIGDSGIKKKVEGEKERETDTVPALDPGFVMFM